MRWLTQAHFTITSGVAFDTPFQEMAVLSVERRNQRRDPNQEDWVLEEERELALS